MGSNAIKTIINCGTTQVSVSIFSERSGTLVLEKLVVENLVYDYTAEDEWELAAAGALRSIFSSLKPKGEVVVIAPGQLLLTKNVKVPQVEKSRQKQIISFEAQNSFPFPLDELVWDSQVISSDGVEEEVILYALKRANAVRFTNMMISAGVTPNSIQPATNLDVQAYRYLTRFETECPPVLLVNVGAHTTNLTFVNDNGFGINNVSIGGNFVTQKLAESTGLPFQAAEQKKIGFFTGAVHLAQGDPLETAILSGADAFIRRLSQEITRRIVNFKRANNGVGPAKLMVSGRGSLLPGFAEKLSELQRMPVEVLDVSSSVECGSGMSVDAIADYKFELQEVVGEAASMVLPDVGELNLLPAEIASEIDFKKKTPFLIVAGLLLAIAPWPVWGYFGEVGNTLKAESKSQRVAIETLKDREKTIVAAQTEAAKAAVYADTMSGILKERYAWNNFLAKLQDGITSLQRSQGVDEDDSPIFKDDRHVWVDKIQTEFEKVAGTKDTPATVRSNVIITFKMLIPSVNGNTPQHDPAAFRVRREVLSKALMDTGMFEKKVKDDIVDWSSRPNVPSLTVTLRLKSDEGI